MSDVDDAPVALPRPVALSDTTQIQSRVTWLMAFRSIVLVALLLTAMIVNLSEGDDGLFGPALLAVYLVCGFSFAVILGAVIWIRVNGSRHIVVVAYIQLAWDSVVAAVLALLTGGVDSAFVFLFFLTVLTAAAVLGRRATYALASFNFVLYLGILAIQASSIASGIGVPLVSSWNALVRPLITNNLSMFLIAALAGFLTDQLRETRQSLTETRAHLGRLEELYAAVLGSVPSGILTVDDAGNAVYMNRAGEEILRQTEVVGRSVSELFPDVDFQKIDVGDRFEVKLTSTHTVGGAVAELTGLENFPGFVVVFQDLSELRQLELEVARSDRLATLGRFSAGLAHEIRNPLASMIGCLQLLEHSAIPDGAEDDARMLSIVHREAERLDRLVTEVLTFARPSLPAKTPIALRTLMEETVEALATTTTTTIEIEIDADLRATGDPQQLKQVAWNLLKNAVGVGATRILIRGESRKGRVELIFEDDGPGVPPEHRAHIFEPFFTTRSSGTGLGLAVCHQVILKHGGRLRVGESDLLGGARFRIQLPIDDHAPLEEISSTDWPAEVSAPRELS